MAFPFSSPHRHPFCRACLIEYIEGAVRQAQCPTCSKPLTVDLTGAGAGAGGALTLVGGGAASPASAPSKSQGGGGVRAPKKHSILSRVNLANFQSSTKIEVCVVVVMVGGGGSAGSEVVERCSFEGACCCCPLHA